MTCDISKHKTFGVNQEAAIEEKRREEKNHDIYLYIKESESNQTRLSKTGVFLRVNPSLHEAAKVLAPVLKTTVSNLYAEALIKHLESLAASLPSTLQLNIIRQIQTKQDSSMLDLEVDLAREDISSIIERIRKLKVTPRWKDSTQKRFLLDQLRKLLPKEIRLAQRSGNEEFQRLILEAREFLRGEN